MTVSIVVHTGVHDSAFLNAFSIFLSSDYRFEIPTTFTIQIFKKIQKICTKIHEKNLLIEVPPTSQDIVCDRANVNQRFKTCVSVETSGKLFPLAVSMVVRTGVHDCAPTSRHIAYGQ